MRPAFAHEELPTMGVAQALCRQIGTYLIRKETAHLCTYVSTQHADTGWTDCTTYVRFMGASENAFASQKYVPNASAVGRKQLHCSIFGQVAQDALRVKII